MADLRITSFLLAFLVLVQGRPQPFIEDLLSTGTSAFSNTMSIISDGSGKILKGSLTNAQRFGDEFAGTAGAMAKTSIDTALNVNRAVGDVSVAALGAVRDTAGVVNDFAQENMRDSGRLASGLTRSSLGTAIAATEMSGRFATDLTGGIIGLVGDIGSAIGQFTGDIVENSVDLTRNVMLVVADMADGAVLAFTGYDPSSP